MSGDTPSRSRSSRSLGSSRSSPAHAVTSTAQHEIHGRVGCVTSSSNKRTTRLGVEPQHRASRTVCKRQTTRAAIRPAHLQSRATAQPVLMRNTCCDSATANRNRDRPRQGPAGRCPIFNNARITRDIRGAPRPARRRGYTGAMRSALFLVGLVLPVSAAAAPFTLEQVMSAPFCSGLVAAERAPRIAWLVDLRGARNGGGAEAPAWRPHAVTHY